MRSAEERVNAWLSNIHKPQAISMEEVEWLCESVRQTQAEWLEEAAGEVEVFLHTDKYRWPGNIPSVIRALIPKETT